MESPKKFNAPESSEVGFEQRMQTTYISPMNEVFGRIQELFPFDQYPQVRDAVYDPSYELNTMPEGNMDESEFKKGLQQLTALSEELNNPDHSREEKLSLVMKTLENLSY